MCDSDDILSPHGKPSEVAISSGMVQKLKSILYNRKIYIYIYTQEKSQTVSKTQLDVERIKQAWNSSNKTV